VALTVRVVEGRSFSRTVFLEGRLNDDTVAALDEALARIVASPAKIVLFDLSGLDYVSSAGLRSFFRTQKVMTQRGGKALLLSPKPHVQKVLEIANASDLTARFTTSEELDQYLDTVQREMRDGE
jgi:anti-anti-sigma factor